MLTRQVESRRKRDSDTGRFIDYYCLECFDEGTVMCGKCDGSGEGMHGDTKCLTCKGHSQVPCLCQEEQEEDDPR